jgi:hypothetical protein
MLNTRIRRLTTTHNRGKRRKFHHSTLKNVMRIHRYSQHPKTAFSALLRAPLLLGGGDGSISPGGLVTGADQIPQDLQSLRVPDPPSLEGRV